MKKLEICLKILFLLWGATFVATKAVLSPMFGIFLIICYMLGIVLVLNKKAPSYTYPKKYKHYDRVLLLRQVEGLILIIFASLMILICSTPN